MVALLVDYSYECNRQEVKHSRLMVLRTFVPIATAHRYCARKFTHHVNHRARALSNEINNDREDGHCYSFCVDLGDP